MKNWKMLKLEKKEKKWIKMNFLSVIIFSNVIKGSLGTSSISESDDFSADILPLLSKSFPSKNPSNN